MALICSGSVASRRSEYTCFVDLDTEDLGLFCEMIRVQSFFSFLLVFVRFFRYECLSDIELGFFIERRELLELGVRKLSYDIVPDLIRYIVCFIMFYLSFIFMMILLCFFLVKLN